MVAIEDVREGAQVLTEAIAELVDAHQHRSGTSSQRCWRPRRIGISELGMYCKERVLSQPQGSVERRQDSALRGFANFRDGWDGIELPIARAHRSAPAGTW